MLRVWEKMANDLKKDLKEIPENINDLVSEVKTRCPELLLKIGLIGDTNVKAESLVALHRFGTWASFGMPIFQVTPDLFASLILTDPQNVLAEEIHLPYKAFLIKIPNDFWELKSFVDEKIQKISWVWVHQYDQANSEMVDTTWWRIDTVADDGTCITYFDQKPEESLKVFLTASTKIKSPIYTEVSSEESGISFSMRRLVVNLCLYLSEVGDIKKKKSYRQSGKQKRKRGPEATIWRVGSNIKIGKDLMDAAKSWVLAKQGDKQQWTIRKRFAVRGHWRNQPYGEKRKKRKKIWIAPHWKGPEKGSRLPRVYDVRE